MNTYVDSSGKRLTDYARPSLAVDTAVFTVLDGELAIATVSREEGSDVLPGTFVHQGETLADAVHRSLSAKGGIEGLAPRQLHVFDEPGRDPRGWVISVAHLVAVPFTRLSATRLTPVAGLGPLGFDHEAMVARALTQLRKEYRHRPDPWRLLDTDVFTLLELERLHRAIDPTTALRDTFRRSMLPYLTPTGDHERGTIGKPARLFRKFEEQ